MQEGKKGFNFRGLRGLSGCPLQLNEILDIRPNENIDENESITPYRKIGF